MLDRSRLATMLRNRSFLIICAILFFFGDEIGSESQSLSSFDECTKLAAIIDCNSKSANKVPSNLPEWAETLKLNKNALTDIPYFTSATNLTHLYLGHNLITSISRNALESMSNLKTLELNNNNVKEVGANDFPSHSKLQILNLNHNDIDRVENGSFNGLKSLVDLKLNRNKLSSLRPDTFKELGALRILELNKNQLRSIPGLTFVGLVSLTTLRLRQNNIGDLPDGAFFGLHSLSDLHLDYNELTSVSGGWLYGLDTLRLLNVSHNKIMLVPDQWSFNSHLKELDLSNNKLEFITKNTFEHLTNLALLKLDYNRISFIEEGAFEFLPSLQTLDLSYNFLSWMVENSNGAFASLKYLQRLSLAGNKIMHVSKNAFAGLMNVTYLDLSNNPIASIEDKVFAKMPSLRELLANTTSLVCDCSSSWLSDWLNETNVVVKSNAFTCVFPRSVEKKIVQNVDPKEFICNEHPQPQITVHPVTTTALVGHNVTLRCGANSSSDSEMVFTWKMNNHRLENVYAKRLESAQNQGVVQFSELQLTGVAITMSGEYQCSVVNKYGVSYSKPSKLSVLVFPAFSKVPVSQTVKVGGPARLECFATGYPKPNIQWHKDNGSDFPAAFSKRMKIMNTGPDEPFFIVDVQSEDSGVYTCIAKNAAGSVNASAVLTVQEPPSFSKTMKNKKVQTQIGESAILECLALGSPKPKVIWRKNGKPLGFNKRYFLASEDQLLVITDVVMEDMGSYECELSNESGSIRGRSELQVVTNVRVRSSTYVSEIRYEDVVGIAITTAVVSIVVTSAVWVVFIHLARKNRRRMLRATPMSPIDCKSENSSHSSKDSGTGDSTKRSYQDLLLTRSNTNHASIVSNHSESPSPVQESTLPLLTTFHPVVVDGSSYSKDTLSSKSKYNQSASLTPVHYQNQQVQEEHVSNGIFCASPASSNGIQCACLTATFKKATNDVCDCVVNHCSAVPADLDVSCYGDVGKRPCSIPVPYHTAHPVSAGCCRHQPNSYLCLYVPPTQHTIPQ